MKKHIANIITTSRIIFSLPLLFVPLSSVWFYVFYLFCGFTDMIDGTVARKTMAASKFGARLDTASDFIFLLVCSIKILPLLHIPLWLWVWSILIALIKIFNITLGFVKGKKLISIHSVLNKAIGFLLFLLPLSLPLIKNTYSILAICVLSTAAAIEEIYYISKGKDVI